MAKSKNNGQTAVIDQTAQTDSAPVKANNARRERLALLVEYVTLLPFITAMITLATKGGKKSAIGYKSALETIGSPTLTAFFDRLESVKAIRNNHFSADDLRIVGLSDGTTDWARANVLVGCSLGAFASILLKQTASRSDVLRAARIVGNGVKANPTALDD